MKNIMNNAPIYITREDSSKLRLFLETALHSNANAALEKLRQELDRAVIIDPVGIPSGVVTIDSRVEYEDLGTGEIEEYIITFPDRAKVEEKRLSILAPIGTALIGCSEGDVVSWHTPGGIRQLKIRRVTPRKPHPSPAPQMAIPPRPNEVDG
jgi:regulator of nucleoside diphosphate kinase